MEYYVSYGDLQYHLKDFYQRTGSRLQFPEVVDYLYRRNLLSTVPPSELPVSKLFDTNMTDTEFDKFMDSLILTVYPYFPTSSQVNESDIIPDHRDVFVIRHPRFTRHYVHAHNYFEINFVLSGNCNFYFEGENRIMKTGELCIIAPDSRHDITIDDESIVITIMIRKSTFNTTFFSLASKKNLLAYFFRTILQGDIQPNYLLFYSEDIPTLKNIIQNAMIESYKRDSFSNDNCICLIQLFFSHLLRNYSKTVQFYDYQMGTDFSLILQYIQHNYQTLTLASLAEFFHYSEPHLSTLIKQNTGCSFTTLVKQLRMSDAISYLTNTHLKISEIAEYVGYNSADHFSRVFRSAYRMSPQEYRRVHQTSNEMFMPFAIS